MDETFGVMIVNNKPLAFVIVNILTYLLHYYQIVVVN